MPRKSLPDFLRRPLTRAVLLALSALGLGLGLGAGAPPPDDLQARLDARFAAVAGPDTPGFAAAVVSGGRIVAEGYYGMADLELGAPVTAGSRFYIGSISKQFTAAILAQLVLEGRLALDDSIRDHVPGLPAIYQAVTVADCLHHTGGVREYTSLMLIRGDDRRLQDAMGQADALALIAAQHGLDFEPGAQQRYSSSGYVLLTALIENIEAAPLRLVARRRLFAPLGMTATAFDDDHGRIELGRVQGYQAAGPDAWRTWLKHFDVVGDGGVLTTVRDLARWDAVLDDGGPFGPDWLALMTRPGRLRDGAALRYAGGLQYDRRRGVEIVRHGGGLGGFIADQIRIPHADLSIYVLANRNDSDAFQGYALLDALIDAMGLAEPEAPVAPPPAEAAAGVDPADWIGAYYSESINNRRFLRAGARGGVDFHDGGDRRIAALRPLGGDRFALDGAGLALRLHAVEGRRAVTVDSGRSVYTALAFDPAPPASVETLARFAGWYCSAELEARVRYAVEDGRFVQRYAQGLDQVLFPAPPGSSVSWNGPHRVWTGTTMVRFDADGIEIGDLRVAGVAFDRCSGP